MEMWLLEHLHREIGDADYEDKRMTGDDDEHIVVHAFKFKPLEKQNNYHHIYFSQIFPIKLSKLDYIQFSVAGYRR